MKAVWILSFLSLAVILSGCDVIEDIIAGETARTITIQQDLLNQTTERAARGVDLAGNVVVTSGQSGSLAPVSVGDLADAIDVATDGMGPVQFFLVASVSNRSSSAVTITFSMYPENDSSAQAEIVSFSLGAYQAAGFDTAVLSNASTAQIHQNLKSVFDLVDEDYTVVPVVTVQGGDANGVLINQYRIWTPPTYLRRDTLAGDSLPGAVEIDRVYDTKLQGAITNEGSAQTLVRIYLTEAGADQEAVDAGLVAETILSPGQTILGQDMVLEGAEDKVSAAFDSFADGADVYYSLVMMSTNQIDVSSDDLQLYAKVEVHADIF